MPPYRDRGPSRSGGGAENWSPPVSAAPGGVSGSPPGSSTLLPLQADSQLDVKRCGLSEDAQTLLDALVPLKPEEEQDEELVPRSERGYVVSIGKKDWKRLHYLGGCSRLPGIHYLNYEFLGEAQPLEDQYDDICRQCWGPRGKAPPLLADEAEEVEVSPDTSEAEDV